MCRIADAISPLEGIETVVEETEDSPALTMQLARLRVLKPGRPLKGYLVLRDAISPLEGIETNDMYGNCTLTKMQLARLRVLKQALF